MKARTVNAVIIALFICCGVISCASGEKAPREPAGETADKSFRTSRVTRTTEIVKPQFEEGYEEPEPVEEVAVAEIEEPVIPDEPIAEEPAEPDEPVAEKPALEEEAAEEEERSPLAGDKETALSRLPALPEDKQKVVDSLEDLKNRKAGRMALGGDLTKTFPEEDEVELGKGVAARILHETPEYENRQLWEYVTFVGLAVADVSSRPTLTYYFTVLDSDEINAFSCPGGFVFITRGAVRACENEAELASILAHEVAHIALDHAVRSLDKAKYRLMMQDALQELDENLPDQDEDFKKLVEELTAISDEFYAMSQNPYNRDLEAEADREALIYLARAGYNPFSAVVMMERLKKTSGEAPAHARALSSHPHPEERIAAMRKAIGELGLSGSGRINEERFRRYVQ